MSTILQSLFVVNLTIRSPKPCFNALLTYILPWPEVNGKGDLPHSFSQRFSLATTFHWCPTIQCWSTQKCLAYIKNNLKQNAKKQRNWWWCNLVMHCYSGRTELHQLHKTHWQAYNGHFTEALCKHETKANELFSFAKILYLKTH